MTCKDCPHHIADSNTCCHQSIKPTIKPSVTVSMVSVTLLDCIKAKYDEAYEYYGDCYDD